MEFSKRRNYGGRQHICDYKGLQLEGVEEQLLGDGTVLNFNYLNLDHGIGYMTIFSFKNHRTIH